MFKKKPADPSAHAKPSSAEAQPAEPVAGPTDVSEIATLRGQIEELRKKAEEFEQVKDTLLRRAADFENAKKRLARESDEMARFAAERIILDLLPIVDNLSRALEHARFERHERDPLLSGVELTLKQVSDLLARHGVEQVPAQAGMPFDPHVHEALAHAESQDISPEHILDVVEAGYRLHGRLLKPARVIVSKGGSGAPPPGSP